MSHGRVGEAVDGIGAVDGAGEAMDGAGKAVTGGSAAGVRGAGLLGRKGRLMVRQRQLVGREVRGPQGVQPGMVRCPKVITEWPGN